MNREDNRTDAEQIAHSSVKGVTDEHDAKVAKVKVVQTALGITYEQALSYVEQELKRKEYAAKYRTSEAYKARLEMQKQVRQLLK